MSANQFDVATLQAGDVLLYKPSSFFGKAISLMTGGGVSHIEVYKGGQQSYASRDGIGVNEYPLRTDDLAFVLRSRTPLDMGDMAAAFAAMKGHKYDWKGILNTATGGKGDSAVQQEVCSEAATIWLRAAGLSRLFGAEEPDAIKPRDYLIAPEFFQFWSA